VLKIALTAVVTAAASFAIAAGTGLARTGAHSYTLHPGDRAVVPGLDFQCQAVSKVEAACGSLKITNSTQVYYSPKQLAVVKFGSTLKKGTILLQVNR
jgi:hypothetical protein